MSGNPPKIVSADRIDGDKILMALSDGTEVMLTVATLLKMFPVRPKVLG
jgi:hypothetical protein